MKDDLAAIFDPFGNATHTALSFDLVGEDVLITGAGPIGMMGAAIARHAGARNVVITDVNPYRLKLAKTMGATTVVDISKESLTEKMKSLGIDWGFTVGLEMSGHPAGFNQMLESMQYGGKVALLGIFRRERLLTGISSSSKCCKSKGFTAGKFLEPGTKWSICSNRASNSIRSSPTILKPKSFKKALMQCSQASRAKSSWNGHD